MSRRLLIARIALVLLLPSAALAQTPTPRPATPANPSGRAPVKTIVDCRAELGLSDAQVEKIKAVLDDFQKQLGGSRAALNRAYQDLGRLLADGASLEAIRAKYQQIGALELEVRMLDVTTSRRVESAMTAEQLKHWKTMQQAARAPKKP